MEGLIVVSVFVILIIVTIALGVTNYGTGLNNREYLPVAHIF